jgi:hypothetical protein
VGCEAVWSHVKRCDLMWSSVISCEAVWSHVKQCDLMWSSVISCEAVWSHVKRCDLMWSGVISCEVVWSHLPQRQKQKFPFKCWYIYTWINNITSQRAELFKWQCTLTVNCSPVSMHPHNMIWNYAIMFAINQIQHHEQQVETWQQRILQTDVFHWSLILVILKQKARHVT